jgi:hypothetical protein
MLDEEKKEVNSPSLRSIRSFSPKSAKTLHITIKGLISSRRAEQPSILKQLCSVDLRVCPIFAVDFSTANGNEQRHFTDTNQPNEYRELLQGIASGYGNILNLPVFGFGAKTSPFLDVASQLFPMTRTIRNPFAPNDAQVLNETYNECLSQLVQSGPANLSTVF